MSTEITSPSAPEAYQLLGVVDAMRRLVTAFGDLPAPYMTINAFSTGGTKLAVQLEDPVHFELWREALELDAEDVRLCTNGKSSWLSVEGTARTALVGGWRVPVWLTGHGLSALSEREAEQVAA